MTSRAPSLVLVAVALALCADAARAQAKTIAVLPLRAEGLQLNDAKRLDVIVRTRAKSRGGFEVQSESLTTDLVEASQGLGVDCDLNAATCGAELGKIADVGFVLLGRATGGVDGRVGVTLRLVDVAAKAEVRTVTALVPAAAESQADALSALADQLFDSAAPLGVVMVNIGSGEPDAAVLVDGAVVGKTPLAAPIGGLAPGEHIVTVEKKGFLPFTTKVMIAGGERRTIGATLVRDPDAQRTPDAAQPWIPYAAAGAGALVAVGGTIALVIGVGPWNEIQKNNDATDQLNTEGRTDPFYATNVAALHEENTALERDWQNWGQSATIAGASLLAVGSLVAIGGVTWGLFLSE